MTAGAVTDDRELLNRWPHIKRFLRVESPGWIADSFAYWDRGEDMREPGRAGGGL